MSDSKNLFAHFSSDLSDTLFTHGQEKQLPKGMEILREGQYVKVIPLVLEGLVKVYATFGEKELLLYYIQPGDSCIMSFAAALHNTPSKVFAVTEEETKALLLPVDKLLNWTKQFPDLNQLFFYQYNQRYAELLETIHHVLFNKMDLRLYDYLLKRKSVLGVNLLPLSHVQIANELGTAREVISRVMKKLEAEEKVKQHNKYIEIL